MQEEYNKVNSSVENGAKRIQGYETQLNKTEAEINKTTNSINKFNKEIKDNGGAIDSASFNVQKLGTHMQKAGGAISSVGDKLTTRVSLPLAGVGIAAAKVGMDFEAEMDKVSAISGATGEDFQKLKAKAEEMGAKTKFSASEAGQGLEYMAMAGWKTGDMLDGIQPILNLAIASGEELGTTSDIVTDALTAFNMTAKDAGKFSDILAAASSNANTNVSMMGETFKYAAPVAGSLGYTAKDTALAIGLMANSGIKASQAGTALRAGLTNLVNPSKEMAKVMNKYGISLKDSKGQMKSFKEVIVELRNKFGKLDKSTQAATISTLFGKEAMSGWLAIINASDQDFNKLSDAIDSSNGATDRMAKTMSTNAKGSISEMKSALEGSAIKVFEALAPTITNVANEVSDLANKFSQLSPETQNFIVKAGMAAVALPPLVSGLGKTISGAGTLIKVGGKLATGLGLISTGAEVASVATTGVAAAAEGATLATGAAGVAATGLGATLASVAAPIAIGVGAIAAIGYAGYKTYKHLTSEATPAVDLFADKAVYSTQKVSTAHGEMTTQVQTGTIKISESTKKAVQSYLDMDKKASSSLMDLRINSDKFTKEAKDKVIKNFEDMSKKSSNLSEEQRQNMTVDFKKLVSDTGTLTDQNKREIIKHYSDMVNGTKNLSNKQKSEIIKNFQETLDQSTSITKEQSQTLQKIYSDMSSKIKTGMDSKRDEDLKSQKDFFEKSNALTTQEEQEILQKTTDAWNKKKENIDNLQKQINDIIQKAADEHRQITDSEAKDIDSIQKQMKEDAIKTLSDNEVEAKVILERMKGNDERITAEEASQHIKELNKSRDEAVKIANDECDKRIAQIIKMRDETGVISSEQADKLIQDAKKSRDQTVSAAEETRNQAVDKIKSMNSQISENVNTTTGEVKSNWNKIKDWWDNWHPVKKVFEIFTQHSGDNESSVEHNWSGDSYFKGGYTTLHENGWELYDLPGGTRIYNHESSEALVQETARQTAQGVIDNFASELESVISNTSNTNSNNPAKNINIKTDLHIGTLNEVNKYDLKHMLDERDQKIVKQIVEELHTY
ncbi:phage tail tape measure protein [Clostridium perfringens]|uniref:phage tail tape measure protein n=2 Tax=Clostridium perfringens TaxID=1502 RepID=UPI001FB1332A|nr:phage tail tape measure protein [Clostridium perfringens]